MEKKVATLIPPNARIVAEFIGEDSNSVDTTVTKTKYLQINPNCNYTVVDNFETKIEKADIILLRSSAYANLPASKVTKIIDKITDYLKDDGMMIIILENLAYADNIAAILRGEPPTVKALLTFGELRNAINKSKMIITKTLHSARETVVQRAIAEIAKASLNVTNYIVCAMKKEAAENIKTTLIQSYLGEVLVCAGVRVNTPNQFMAASPGVYVTSNKSGETVALSPREKYNNKIFINQRVSSDSTQKGIEFFDSIVKHNYLMIEEMDDNPVLWQKKYEAIQFINFIAVHGVQTSTKALADFFKQFNPNVRIFENQLSELPPARDYAAEIARNEPVTIFFGALNRDKDFYDLLPAVNRIAAEYGDNVAFKVIARTKLFDSIESKNKTYVGRKEVYDGQYVPYEVYEQALRTTHIALLPLRDNIFNRSKSDLKFIECAGNGSVALASPTVYSNTIKDGETGFIYQDVNDFYNKLKLLINNHNKRREMAEKAYDYVKHNRLLSQHYEERWDWYNELLARLPELNAETYKRIELLKTKGLSAFGGFADSDTTLDFKF